MAHHEVVFPEDISYGSEGGPSFSTSVTTLDGGGEVRIARWATPRHKYDVANGIKTMDDLYELKEFYIARMGALHSFNFRDPQDYATTANGRTTPNAVSDTDVTLPAGDGTTTRQMVKSYVSGGITRTRTITKPKSGTVKVKVNSVALVEGVGFTVDYTTGIITFASAPTGGQSITFGCEFYVPARFAETTDEWLSTSFEGFDAGDMAIEVIEVNDGLDLPEEFFYGGSLETTMSADLQMAVGTARVYVVNPQSSSPNLKLKLPDETNLPPGAPYFLIVNESSTHPLDITKSDGTAVMTLAAGNAVEAALSQTNASTKEWYCF